MAAYAALVSLLNTAEQIHNHPRLPFSFEEKQIKSLLQIADFLLDFIEGHSHGGCKRAQILESQIASAAHKAEDVIETHVVTQIHAESIPHRSFLADLQKAIEEMDSVKKMAMRVKGKKGFKEEQPTHSNPVATSSRSLTAGKSSMVGFDDELLKLMDLLTRGKPDRRIIPIVGMGGIGKTTLARNVYKHSLIEQYFHVRTWVTVSQKYSVRDILLELLSVMKNQNTSDNLAAVDKKKHQEDELGEQLYKILCGRRYLIILDDIWSIEAWNEIESFFPKSSNGSRVIVTTRLSNLAMHFGSSCLEMKFLDENQCWKLFCANVFAGESCPHELMNVGKKIVGRCKGLPLSIVVMGGFLRKAPRSQQYWGRVAEDIYSILNSSRSDRCSIVLSLSYKHLPPHLRPCFLYMGVFPEDCEIRVSRLVKLWVAEGFLKQDKACTLEATAESYLSDLVERNLILARRWRPNGKIKTCYVHDLIRDLCLRVSVKEKFLCVMGVLGRHIVFNEDTNEHIVFRKKLFVLKLCCCSLFLMLPSSVRGQNRAPLIHALESASMVRSLNITKNSDSFKFRLLRVLNVFSSDCSLNGTFKQVNLKYLACDYFWTTNLELPSSISLLWNVQTLILRGGTKRILAPYEIWDLRQLRHLEFDEIYVPNPHLTDQKDDEIVLPNLQTLLKVVNFKWSDKACKSIPNITKLHVKYDDFSYEYCLYNIGSLQKLESLNCFFEKLPDRDDLLQNLKFPSSLKKLCLTKCQLQWDDLTMIGSLPHLEVLKLGLGSVVGAEWNPVEGQFLCLKYLKIHYSDLMHWNAESWHFPILECLVLDQLFKLDEIPSSIGDIHSLKVIHLDYCKVSAAISAMNILEEQEKLGNEGLQVRALFWPRTELESIEERLQEQSFNTNNFFLNY